MGFVFVPVHLLDFETAEETLHRCVVVAIAFAAHALQKFAGAQAILIGQTRELRSTIAVNNESGPRVAQCDRLIQGIECQSRIDVATGGPSDDAP